MGWENIEELSSETLREELFALLSKEKEYAPITSTSTAGNPQDVDERPSVDVDPLDETRLAICQWNYECVDYFMLDREVVYMSMNFFDRYVAAQTATVQRLRDSNGTPRSAAPPLSSMVSHLIALTSLQLACKLHGQVECPSSGPQRRVKLRMEDFCHMSRGTYCVAMLEDMELSLLTNLQWKLHPPTPLDFLMRYIKILSTSLDQAIEDNGQDDVEVHKAANLESGWSVFEVARYQTELAVYNRDLCQKFPPSTIALAATLNAMNSVVVSTRRTVVSSRARSQFLHQMHSLGGADLQEADDIVEARTLLKKLCSKTIILPGKSEEETSSESTEYELPDIQSFEYDVKDDTGKTTFSPTTIY
eukprot:CCRYP_000787-RA/>CCRYP_000787-RA protein AED:0.15 eAED:0.15 QI:0/1/0.5/1/0/0/2/999/361